LRRQRDGEHRQGPVQGTVCTVKESIDDTVDTMRDTLDLELQTRRHPWALVGAAVGAGFVSGAAFSRLAQQPTRRPAFPPPLPRELPEPVSARTPVAPSVSERAHSLIGSFEPELAKVKGMALGALFNVVKSAVQPYVPPSVKPQFTEVVDSITRKLGGQPLQGSLMDDWKSPAR